ncbi:MAG: hypothetical protein HUJ75_05950, partial [Parasporobacterium sp.]|nr:hypothetical protein [Parasporobacterium sp.]
RQCYLASAHFVANGLTRVENHLAENDTYVLFVADSMTIPMTTFTGLTCKKAELIDPRYFKSGISDYIKEHKPDIVINSYSTTAVQDFYPLFDFE